MTDLSPQLQGLSLLSGLLFAVDTDRKSDKVLLMVLKVLGSMPVSLPSSMSRVSSLISHPEVFRSIITGRMRQHMQCLRR